MLDDTPAPALRAYPKATVVAEKLHAVTILGMTNSRMKDFFDLWALLHDTTLPMTGVQANELSQTSTAECGDVLALSKR